MAEFKLNYTNLLDHLAGVKPAIEQTNISTILEYTIMKL